jgi:hypothetical protein
MATAASSETTNLSQSIVTRDAVDKRTPSQPASAGDHPKIPCPRDAETPNLAASPGAARGKPLPRGSAVRRLCEVCEQGRKIPAHVHNPQY